MLINSSISDGFHLKILLTSFTCFCCLTFDLVSGLEELDLEEDFELDLEEDRDLDSEGYSLEGLDLDKEED